MTLNEALAVYIYGQFSHDTPDRETYKEAWAVICEEARYIIRRELGNENG